MLGLLDVAVGNLETEHNITLVEDQESGQSQKKKHLSYSFSMFTCADNHWVPSKVYVVMPLMIFVILVVLTLILFLEGY